MASTVAIADSVMASTVAIADPVSFRVGAFKKKYNYERIAPGIYKCSRGSDWAPHLSLFLFHQEDYWYAVDAPSDSSLENIAEENV